MTIGETARRSGFTVKALRFYDRRGLLPPAGRSAGGYRVYAEPALHRLEFIRQAKGLGFTLDAIHELLGAVHTPTPDGPRARLRSVLGARIALVTRQIETLTQLRDDLQRRQRRLGRRTTRRDGRTGACTCLSENGRR
jgi:DNA-binding transcriptional MerR regulator